MDDFFSNYQRQRYLFQRDFDYDRNGALIEASHTTFTGTNGIKGRTLAAEIERYRRAVESLIRFLVEVAPDWWDKRHPFKGDLVLRPSKSADQLRAIQSRLNARLGRLTSRVILPAAAAVVSIEEQDKVTVMPPKFFQPHSVGKLTAVASDVASKLINTEEQLTLALSISRRLGEIERLKQELILYALDWIDADGNDQNLRLQRYDALAEHVEACLIEKHEGVRALIKHYFRRRSESNAVGSVNNNHYASEDPKIQLKYAFNAVTADTISSTSRVILNMLEVHEANSKNVPIFKVLSSGSRRLEDVKGIPKDFEELSVEELTRWAAQHLKAKDESTTDNSTSRSEAVSVEWLGFSEVKPHGESLGPNSLTLGSLKSDLETLEDDGDGRGGGLDLDKDTDFEDVRQRLILDMRRREHEASDHSSSHRRVLPRIKSFEDELMASSHSSMSTDHRSIPSHGGGESSTISSRMATMSTNSVKRAKNYEKRPPNTPANETSCDLGEEIALLGEEFRKSLSG
ncbi:unnamed protein product [Mesocestoides corti]|uniref:DUF5738 domain-containing protein n=1 Tax=Mesocestoides corti TaxID=53468 RepID=A0A0R3UPE7_MESCO|nr:unnamed protein product [Mesocestoides corti]